MTVMDLPQVADSEWADVGSLLLTMMDLPHSCRGPALAAEEAATASLAAPASFFVPMPSGRNAARWFPLFTVFPAQRPEWFSVPRPIEALGGAATSWNLEGCGVRPVERTDSFPESVPAFP